MINMGKLSFLTAISVASTALMTTGQVQAITYQSPPVTMSYHNGVTSKAISVKTDSQNNIYEAVTSKDLNGKIIKYTPNGQTAWTVDFDLNNPRPADKMSNFVTSTGIAAVTVDRNDNIYAVGESYNGVTLDCLLKKYDTNGTLIWQTRYTVPKLGTTTQDQYCHDITVDKAGDIIAGGTSLSFTGIAYNGYGNQLLKWDASGKLIGKFNVTNNGNVACGAGAPCQTQIMKVVTDLNQNIYTIAKSGGIYANSSYYSRFSKDLTPLSSPYVGINSYTPTAIAVDTQGHVYGSGYETAYNPLGVDVYRKMSVLDSNLNQLCEDKRFMASIMRYADPTPYGFNAIVIGPDEKAYLAGSQDKSFGVMEYNAQCQPQWVDAAGNPALLKAQLEYSDYSNAITLDNNNNLIVAGGYLKSDRVTTDAATVKFSPVVTPTSSDLIIGGVYSDSTYFKTGQMPTVKGYFLPTGSPVSGTTWLGLYLSTTDHVINRQDILLSRTPYNNLNIGVPAAINVTGKFPDNLPTGTYYLGVLVDDGNLIAETNETNNEGSFLVQYTALPDLVVVSGSAPTTAKTGQQVTVTATIKNQGAGTATTSSTAGIYISSDSTTNASDKLVCTAAVGALEPGVSQNISCTGTIPMDTYGGNVYIGALADNSNAVEETNEANNGWSQAFSLTAIPDLVISTAVNPASAKRGQQITVNGTIKNQGYGATGYFFVIMYLSQDNLITSTDTGLCSVGFSGVLANTTSTFTCTGTIPSTLAAGNYSLGFVADGYNNSVAESDETNNIKINTIAITQ